MIHIEVKIKIKRVFCNNIENIFSIEESIIVLNLGNEILIFNMSLYIIYEHLRTVGLFLMFPQSLVGRQIQK